MAFQQADGKVAWAKGDLGNVYSSPVLINVSGLEQLAVLLDGAVLAVNPHNGDLQWQVPFKADYSNRGGDARVEFGQPAIRVVRIQRRYEGNRAEAKWSADDSDGIVELQSPVASSRQRNAPRFHDLFLERRKGQPGDSDRGRRAAAKSTGSSARSRRRRSSGQIRS
jgi:hypothetical protein